MTQNCNIGIERFLLSFVIWNNENNNVYHLYPRMFSCVNTFQSTHCLKMETRMRAMQNVMNILSETSAMRKLNYVKRHCTWVYINSNVSCVELWWISALVQCILTVPFKYNVTHFTCTLFFKQTKTLACCIYHITSNMTQILHVFSPLKEVHLKCN